MVLFLGPPESTWVIWLSGVLDHARLVPLVLDEGCVCVCVCVCANALSQLLPLPRFLISSLLHPTAFVLMFYLCSPPSLFSCFTSVLPLLCSRLFFLSVPPHPAHPLSSLLPLLPLHGNVFSRKLFPGRRKIVQQMQSLFTSLSQTGEVCLCVCVFVCVCVSLLLLSMH